MLRLKSALFAAATLLAATSIVSADELHLTHVNPPGDLISQAADRFAAAVAERTNGDITIAVHPASSLAGLRDGVEGAQLGTIDIAVADSGTLGNWIPEMGLFSLPFLFDDFDHQRRVFAGPVGDWRREQARAVMGVEMIGSAPIGQRVILSTSRAINGPEDIRGLTFRVPEIPVYVRMVTTLGGNPTPIPFADLYVALQTDVVEAAEGTATSHQAAKLHEVTNYASRVHHIMLDNAVVMNGDRFDGLAPEHQQVIRDAASEFFDIWLSEQRETAEDEAWAFLAEHVEANDSPDREAFRTALQPLIGAFVAETGTEELLQYIDDAR